MPRREYVYPIRGDTRTGIIVSLPLSIEIEKKYAILTNKCRRPIAIVARSRTGQWEPGGRSHYDMARDIRPIDIRLARHLNRIQKHEYKPPNNRGRKRRAT